MDQNKVIWNLVRIVWLIGGFIFIVRFNDFEIHIFDFLIPLMIIFPQIILIVIFHIDEEFPSSYVSTDSILNYKKEKFIGYLEDHKKYLWIGLSTLILNNFSLMAVFEGNVEISHGFSTIDDYIFIGFSVYNYILLLIYPLFLKSKWRKIFKDNN